MAGRAVLDEADVVAGVDAEHGEQLQGVPGQRVAPGRVLCHLQGSRVVTLPAGVGVHLEEKRVAVSSAATSGEICSRLLSMKT